MINMNILELNYISLLNYCRKTLKIKKAELLEMIEKCGGMPCPKSSYDFNVWLNQEFVKRGLLRRL